MESILKLLLIKSIPTIIRRMPDTLLTYMMNFVACFIILKILFMKNEIKIKGMARPAE